MLQELTPNDLIWHPAVPGVNRLVSISQAVIGGHRGRAQSGWQGPLAGSV